MFNFKKSGAPETRAQRQRQRKIASFFIVGLGVVLIFMGLDGWTVDSVPAYYVGAFFVIFRIVGMFGVNIWKGGILDPNNDPPDLPKEMAGADSANNSGVWPPPPSAR